MTTLTDEQFKQLREQLTGFFWDAGLDEFCKAVRIDPHDPYAQEKWEAFTTCVRAMQGVPDAMWTALLIAAQEAEPTVSRGSR